MGTGVSIGVVLWIAALVLVVAGFFVGMIFALKNQREACVVQALVTEAQQQNGVNVYTYSYVSKGDNYTLTAQSKKKYSEGDQTTITIDSRNPGILYSSRTMMIAECGMWMMIAGLIIFTVGVFFI